MDRLKRERTRPRWPGVLTIFASTPRRWPPWPTLRSAPASRGRRKEAGLGDDVRLPGLQLGGFRTGRPRAPAHEERARDSAAAVPERRMGEKDRGALYGTSSSRNRSRGNIAHPRHLFLGLVYALGQELGATPNGRRAGNPISAVGANPIPYRKDGAVTAIAHAVRAAGASPVGAIRRLFRWTSTPG